MKKRLDEKVMKNRFRVAIFGSARIKKDDSRYKLIHRLAKMLAADGIDIVTGGGPGLMDAASRGHHAGRKGKNHVYAMGLTIHMPKEQKESYHLDLKKDFHKFSNRLDNFIHLSNVVVVAPGGIGTVLELMYVWQLVQVKHSCEIPIILFGDIWTDFIKWIKKGPLQNRFLDKNDLELLYHARNCTEVMKIIELAHEEYKKGRKKICLNIHKYKVK